MASVVSLTKNGFGCLQLDKTDDVLELLPRDVPVVCFYHGGAMTIGSYLMTEAIDLLNQAKIDRPFIYLSVEYSQAPEAPFPAAPCDACSVTEQLLNRFDNVHLCGVSAGGYLALVSGVEACRTQRHENLKSILALAPMLDPSLSIPIRGASDGVFPANQLSKTDRKADEGVFPTTGPNTWAPALLKTFEEAIASR